MAKNTPKGKAIISLLLDSSALEKDLKRVEANFKRVGANILKAGAGLAAFGAGLAAPIIKATKQFINFGDQVDKIAARTGASTRFISALGFAAEQSGADIQTLEKAIIGQQRTLDDMNQGLKTAIDSYAALGLEAKDFSGLSVEESFLLIADRLSKIDDPSLKAAKALEIFGKSGQRLIPLLSGGSAAIKDLVKEADKLGIIITPEEAKKAADLTDGLNRLTRSWRGLLNIIGSAVSDEFLKIADQITAAIVKTQQFIKQNKGLVVSILKISAGAVALGAALIAVGGSIVATGVIIGSIASIVGTLSASFVLLKGAVLATGGAIAVAFTSPLLGASIVIGSIITEVLELRQLFKGLTNDVSQDFKSAFGNAKNNFDLFKQAILAGDLKLAFQILTTSIKLFFLEAFDSAIKKFDEVKSLFLIVINEIIGNAKKLGINIAISFNAIKLAAAKAADFLLNAFKNPLKTIENIFILLIAEIQKAWITLQGAVKAGVQFGKGDRKGAIETIRAIEDQKADIEKAAQEKIVANIVAGDKEIKSKAVKELEEEAKLIRQVYNDLENEISKKTEDIFKQPEIRDQERQKKIDKLKEELEALGLSLNNVTEKAKENVKQTDKGTQNFSKGITSLVPKFGKAVEAGSSAAVQLFGTSSPLLREQQKQSKILSSIAQNTEGLTTG